MKLLDARVLFLDLQTTGATPVAGNILEIAWRAACARNQSVEDAVAFLVQQPEGKPIPGRISALTGIAQEDMLNAVDSGHAQKEVLDAIERSDNRTLIIHYARFERPFLQQLLGEHLDGTRIYCTHEIARRLFPNLPSRGIRALSGYFGLHVADCKRASSHVSATYLIWKSLCDKLAEVDINTFDQLDTWLADAPIAKRTKYVYPLNKEIRLKMPDAPGIYRMLSCTGAILYVGKATSLKSRVNSYFRGQRGRESRKLEMLTQTWDIRHTVCGTVVEACVLEADEIKRLSPPYNVSLKTGERPLLFYALDFSSADIVQSAQHEIGPFRSPLVMDGFVRLLQSLRSGVFDQLIFFDELPPELIQAGFAIFHERHAPHLGWSWTQRNLLALGMKFYRLHRHLEEEVAEGDEEEPAPADETSAEPEELTVDEVADKFERLLRRTASAYLLSKRLTALLNARVQFEENSKLHDAIIVDGQIDFAPHTFTLHGSSTARHRWSGLDIQTFDRMRVFHTELMRIRSSGGRVFISVRESAPQTGAISNLGIAGAMHVLA